MAEEVVTTAKGEVSPNATGEAAATEVRLTITRRKSAYASSTPLGIMSAIPTSACRVRANTPHLAQSMRERAYYGRLATGVTAGIAKEHHCCGHSKLRQPCGHQRNARVEGECAQMCCFLRLPKGNLHGQAAWHGGYVLAQGLMQSLVAQGLA